MGPGAGQARPGSQPAVPVNRNFPPSQPGQLRGTRWIKPQPDRKQSGIIRQSGHQTREGAA